MDPETLLAKNSGIDNHNYFFTKKKSGWPLTPPIEPPLSLTQSQADKSAILAPHTQVPMYATFTVPSSRSFSLFRWRGGREAQAEKRHKRVAEKNANADERAKKRSAIIEKGGLGALIAKRQNKIDDLFRKVVVARHVTPTAVSEIIRSSLNTAIKASIGVVASMLTWSLAYHAVSGLWVLFLGSTMNPALALSLSIPIAWWIWECFQIDRKISKRVGNMFGVGTPTKKKDAKLKEAGLDNPNRIR